MIASLRSLFATGNRAKIIMFSAILAIAEILCASTASAQNTLDLTGLDNTAPSAAAYSVRRLSTSYTGNLIKVRRSSDNGVLDIGYNAGNELDTAALKTFVGSGSGFIDTWYDQSGNGRNQTQATTGNQPRIVNAGVIERQNNRPVVYFNGSTYMASPSFSALSSGFTVAIIAGVNSNVTFNTFANKTQSNIGMPFDQWNTNYYIGNGTLDAGPRTLSTGISSTAGYSQWSYAASPSAAGAWRLGVSNTSTTAPTYYSDGNVPFMLGSRQDLATHLDGYIGEVVLFPAFISTGNRNIIERSQMNYMLPITGNTTLSTAITTQLTGGATGGTWSSSATGVATVGSSTGLVSGVSAGTATITYTLSNGSNSTVVVTVKTPNAGIYFDGSNDQVAVPYSADMEVAAGTVEAWVRPDWVAGSRGANAPCMFAFRDVAGFRISFHINSNLNGVVLANGITGATTSYTFVQGTWYHIAITYSASSSTVFVNGVNIGTNIGINTGASGRSFRIGMPDETNTGEAFQGNIDEVRVWNTTRTQTEIQTYMNCDVSQQVGLAGYYRFDEGAPAGTNTGLTLATDYSGNNNCGILTNLALTGSTSNYTNGAVGGCNTISTSGPGSFTGTTQVCAGANTTLGNSVVGGRWSSSAPGVATISSTTGVVTGVAAGTTVITYKLFCQTATTVVTVMATPAAITGNTTLSTAITTQLTDATGGGTWSSSATGVATVNSTTGLVTGVSAGTSTITYTTGSGCSAVATVTVKTPGVGLRYDGTGDYVGVSNNSAFETTTGTLEAWVNIGWNSVASNPCFISMRPSVIANTRYSFHIAGNRSAVGFFNGSVYLTTPYSFSQNVWYHIAIVYSTSVCSVYVNGSYIGNIAAGIATTTGHQLRIGAADDGFTTEFWLGSLDEVRIWNTQRTATEIANNANCDVSQQAGLVGYYRFDEGTAGGTNTAQPQVIDYSGNGYCGTLNNFTLTGSSSNFVTGAIGSCNNISISTPAAIGGTTGICGATGATTTLTNAAGGGRWSSSATGVATIGSSSGVVTSVSTGTTVITYSLNCQIATAVVTVNANPAAIGGSSSVCTGVTTTLTNATGGGAWSSSAPAVGTIDPSTGVLGGVSAGTSTITYTLTATGCYAVKTITVNSLPAAITGNGPICVNNASLFTDATSSGVWSSSATGVATVGSASGLVSGVSAGTAIISYTVAGCSAFFTTTVVSAVIPTVTSVSPMLGFPSAAVTITGTNFNTVTGNNLVTFGAVRATVTAATTTSLTVTVPARAIFDLVKVENTACALFGSATHPFLPTYDNTSYAPNSVNFDARVDFNNGAQGIYMAMGDLNSDGKPDVVMSNTTGTTISVYENTSTSGSITSGSFAAPFTLTVGSNPFTVLVYDIDGDGKPEILAANLSSNTISVFQNIHSGGSLASGSFAAKFDLSTARPWGLAALDVDGDGKQDIVVTNDGSAAISVFKNNSSVGNISASTFASAVSFTVGSGPRTVVTGDFDHDGKIDVACNNQSSNTISVLRNTATAGVINSSSFATHVTFNTSSGPSLGLVTADFDGDGWLDIACNNQTSNNISVFRNNQISGNITTSSFLSKVDFSAPNMPLWMTVSDFDGDSKPDICFANNSTATVSVFLNTATSGAINSSSFASTVNFATAGGNNGVLSGDIDGDGRPEILAAATGASKMSVLRNNPIAPIVGTMSICQSATTTLSCATSSGTWSSSSTGVATVGSTTGIVTAVSVGTAIISYNVGSSFAARTVTVNAAPAAIGGSSSVCQFASTTLTNATGGGTWSSSAVGVATIGSSTGILTGVSAGTTIVTYALSSGCYATRTNTVISGPLAITGNTTLSTTITTQLADATGGGTWSSSATGVATVSSTSGLVTGVSAGTATITYSLASGCSVNTAVTVKNPNSGLNLDGVNDRIDGANASLPQGSAARTIEAWINMPSFGGLQLLFNWGTFASNQLTGLATYNNNLYYVNEGNDFDATSATLSTNTWTHVAATMSGTSLNFYVNGVLVQSGSLSGGAPNTTGTGWTIGNTTDFGSPRLMFNGTIDEVRIWNVVRTQSEIATNMNCDVSQQAGLVAYYRFDEGIASGTNTGQPNVMDYSGTGSCGALSNFTLTGGSSNFVTGAIGSCNTISISTPAAIGGSTAICGASGTTTTLTNAAGGGRWSSSATGVATIGSSTGVVTSVSVGTTVITYSLNCQIATTVVTVSAAPAAISGTNICNGSSATFTNGTGGGTWSSSAVGVATVGSTTGSVTGVSAGSAIISYTLASGCYATLAVTVNAMPAGITGNTTLSTSIKTQLANTVGGGIWSSSATGIASVGSTTGLVTGASAGTAMITYSLPGSCYVTAAVTVKTPGVGISEDGTDDYIDLGNPAAMRFASSDQFTAEMWLNPLVVTGGWHTIIDKSFWNSSQGFIVYINAGTLTVAKPEIPAGFLSTSITQGVWSHVAVTYNNGVWRLFLNGAQVGSSFSSGSSNYTNSTTNWFVGMRNANTGSGAVDASNQIVDELRIWNVERSQSQIQTNMNCDVSRDANLLAYYRFDEGSPSGSNTSRLQTYDYSGNSFCATLKNMALTGSTSNFVTGGNGSCNTISMSGPGAISGNTIVCGTSGGTTTLSNSVPSGIWTSSATGVATVGSSSGIVTSVSAGTTVITYSLNCQTAIKVVTVAASPAAIAGNTSLTTAITSLLTDATGGGTWSSSATGVATVGSTTGVVAGVSAGTAVISYLVSSGCYSTTTVTIMTPRAGLHFDGSDDYVQGVNQITIGTADFTVEAWIYPENLSGYRIILAQDISGVAADQFRIALNGNKLNFSLNNSGGGGIFLDGATSLTTNKWWHVAYVRSGADHYVYLNGVLDGSVNTGSAVNNLSGSDPNRPLRIGARGTLSSASEFFVGRIDEVRYWTTARTQTEIKNNMSCNVAQQAGLRHYYRFDEGTAGGTNTTQPQTMDYSGNSNCGILKNFALTGASSNFISGAVGDCNTITIATPAAIGGTASVCQGATTTLTNAVAGGTWSSSATGVATVGTTGVVSGVAAGTAIITYNLNCQIATKVVTVNATPAAIVGSSSVCTGLTTTLTNATGGGTWSSTATGVATIGSTSGVLTGVSAGTTIVTYTLSSGCYGTSTRTVFATPAAITGNTTLTTAITTLLSDVTGGGTWSSSATGVATVGSLTGVVSGVGSGTSIISYTVSSGCRATVTVTVINRNAGINLDGTNDRIDGVNTALPQGGSDRTIEAWVNIPSSGSQKTLFNWGTFSSNQRSGLLILGNNIYFCNESNDINATSATIPANTWTHVAVTLTGTTANFYINGVLAQTGALPSGAPNTTGYDWSIGNTVGSGSPRDMFQGTIDEVRVWNVARTQTEIVNNMNCDVSQQSSLVAYYRFNEGSPGSINTSQPYIMDYSGNYSCGLLSNFNLVGGGSNFQFGAIGSCNTISINTPAAITGASSICGSSGGTITLSNSVPGGVWSSGATGVATVGSTGDVTSVSAGTTVITYTLNCRIATNTITVNPTPASIGGTMLVCQAATTALTNATGGGTWSSSATGVATVGSATGILTGVSAGTSNITYTLPTGCIATSAVTVNPAPATITGTTSACPGFTSTLSSATPSGNWSSSALGVATVGTLTGVVSAVSAGTATITYTRSNGCYTTATFTTNPLPAAIGGVGSVCAGFTTTYTGTGGGTWSSSATGTATVGSSTGVVTGVAAGSATITYTLGTGCYATAGVTVNAVPAAIGGTAKACVGFGTTLTNTVSGGTWTSGATGIATVGTGTGVVTAVSAGTATITYTRSNGCFATKEYTVNANPAAIGGTTNACLGFTSTLTNATGGGTWTSSASTIASVGSASGTVTGIAAASATITYTLGTGCYATSGFTVNANPATIGGTKVACEGFGTTLTNSVGGGTWMSANTGIATIGSTSGAVSGVSAGTTTITYTRSNGCYATTTYTVNTTPAAIGGTLNSCIGFSSTLTNATGGGTWTSASTGIATAGAGTGVVTGIVAGTANITYTLGTGCYASANYTVNANPASITGTTNVCTSGTTTLSDATGGGAWTVSNANATMGTGSGVVTGVTAGTATVSYTLATGCYKTINITIYETPAAISGTSGLCAGGATTLSNMVSGGVWSSSNTAVASVGSATGVVTGVAGGSATITYNTGGTCYATFATTIGAILPITGTPSACTGASSTLSCGSAGGTWSSGNTAVATIGSTGVMTGVSVGTSVITYALPSGCARYVTVYISDPGSSISGPSSVCIGQTITLTDAAAPGGAWTSSNGGIASVGLFTGVVTGRLASSATITYTLGSSCYITKTLTVNSFSSSYAAVTNVMVGNTITMGNAMSGGTWSSSATGVATVNSTTGVVTGVSAGTASISYTVASGCTDYINVTVNAAPSPISGPSAVCIGQSVTLTSGTPGGVWTSSNGGIALVGSSTGIVTGRLASTVNITYTVGGTYSVRTMTVTSFSPSYASVYTVMSGNTISMNNTTSGGTWSSTNTGVATVNSTSGLVTGVGAGTTIISYAVASGCSDGTTITVSAAPSAITGPSVVCFSQTATLSSATPGGVWSTSNGAIATVGSSTGIVTPLIAAPVNITYTVGSGYAVKSMTVANFSPVYASVTTINSGNTTTIFDATSGGVWSSSAPAIATVNSTTGVVTGVLSGTTMISYTMPTGCTDGIMVTVAPAPAIGAGPGQVCVGSTLTLTHATPGGVWTSSNGGIALVGSSTGIVTGRIAATCTITYTLPTSVYVTTTITVLPSAAISGQTKICNGQSLTLTNSIAGGTWYSSNGGVAAAGSTTGVISGVSLGTSIISYVLPTGCYALKTVTVVAAMTSIIGTPEVCNGSSVTLTHATTGGAWSSSNTGVATAVLFGGSITGVSAGTTSITYTVGPACKTAVTFTVDPVPAAIGGGNSVCVSTPITLTNATGGGVWSSLDPSIATVGSSTGLVTGVTSGFTTTISYTLPTTGCYAVNSMAVNPCRFAGDEEVAAASVFTLIPNPNSGTFVLKGSYASQTVEEASIEVVNTLGQSVYRKTINSVRGKIEEEIQLPGTLANGMYLLNLHTSAEQRVFHFVISK